MGFDGGFQRVSKGIQKEFQSGFKEGQSGVGFPGSFTKGFTRFQGVEGSKVQGFKGFFVLG